MDSGTELFLRQEMGTNNNPALPPAGPNNKKKWSAPAITLASPGAALGSVDEYSTEVNYDRRESSDSRSGGSRRGSTASGLGLGMGLLFASRRPSRDSASRRGSESAASIASVSSSGRRDSTPGPQGLQGLPQGLGLDDKGAKGRRRSWHVAKLERKRRKGVTSPTALSDSEAPNKPREKRPSWWNIFASDKTR
ncbi:GTPase Der [Frankliniella fusca]|uniref:GTPase Der n=1 Tax=Frankliniella fusca TaxID=407009 RepID=A0AAE1LBL9_9NEOP|nr:GTPase Der [Frankliniella fusca]